MFKYNIGTHATHNLYDMQYFFKNHTFLLKLVMLIIIHDTK